MNHTITLLKILKTLCILKNKLHQMFSLKKLSQKNISPIQKLFKTVILMRTNFLNCHALKFSIGKLSSYGKRENFCTINFSKTMKRSVDFQCWLSGKSWSVENKSPIFWYVNVGNQKCLTGFEFKDMIGKKFVFSQKKALRKCWKCFLFYASRSFPSQDIQFFNVFFALRFFSCYQMLNVIN